MSKIQSLKLKDVCLHRKEFITISDDEKYKRCRVQLHRKGIVLRDEVFGSEIKTKKQRLCKHNNFIVAEMDAKFGGYGIIPDFLEGAIVSSHYYLYQLDQQKILPEYLHVVIQSGKIQEQIKAVGSTNYSRVSPKEVLEYKIPCPDISKQLKIIERFQRAETQLEKLSTELTSQQTLLKQLRQSILQDAVSGKLTEKWRKDNPDVEPAADLLKRIKAEKDRLVKEKKIKPQKPLPPITNDEIPFDLPKGWGWCRLGEAGLFERGKSKHRPRNDETLFVDGSYPFVQTGDVAQSKKTAYIIKSYAKCYNEKGLSQSRMWKTGTLCITIAANIAETGFLGLDACFPDSVVGFTPFCAKKISNYVRFYIEATKSNISHYAPATAQKNINLGIIDKLIFPLPPEKEIEVIGQKVGESFKTCDHLESHITQSRQHAEMLMQAVLKEAFEG